METKQETCSMGVCDGCIFAPYCYEDEREVLINKTKNAKLKQNENK